MILNFLVVVVNHLWSDDPPELGSTNPSDNHPILGAARTRPEKLCSDLPSTTGSQIVQSTRRKPTTPFQSPQVCIQASMGSSDVAPAHVPDWVVPLSTVALGVGVLFWDATYILMTLRSLRTKSYSMPLLGLALNVSWEIVYALYVCEALIETAGFTIWLILDIGLIYTTIKFAPYEWDRTNAWVGRHMASILGLMTAIGCVGHFAFVKWWLSRPGM